MTFISQLSQGNGNITLNKFDGTSFPRFNPNHTGSDIVKVCFLDLETTGLDKIDDKIIELALKLVAIDRNNGELLGVIAEYQSFHDPNELIDEKITLINGINNEMVQGCSIDWDEVNNLISTADIILAHNASFDRAFMDRYLSLSTEKIWSCSISDIDWLKRGFTSNKQELLCFWHGFYYDSHRAMFDVDALIGLLTHESYKENKPMIELIENAGKPYYKLLAIDSPYDTKDKLKANDYNWDPERRSWWKRLQLEEIETEQNWLTENIYNGHFTGTVEEIPLTEKYK